jgi:hypothetical protein
MITWIRILLTGDGRDSVEVVGVTLAEGQGNGLDDKVSLAFLKQ